jgi:F0F1-type ATP synthase membrane subunit b/b'
MSAEPELPKILPANTPEAAPNFTEPIKWLSYHLSKDWRMMAKAPIAFLAVLIFSIIIAWLFTWQVVVPEKNEQLNTRQEIINQKQSDIDSLSKQLELASEENAKLDRQNEQIRALRGKDAPPLKQEAFILAQQIHDYIKNWKDSDPQQIQYINIRNYLNRFGLRASLMRDDLDQNGQDLPDFDKLMYNFDDAVYNHPNPYDAVRTIADSIEKLANNLPD